ncbi:MAG: hypothetical protein E6Q40_01365 [Cupriavidus sp.]|nr:MAG: hypothetical protein E6Q40_01365 [Cupriavidus sp.]
MTNKAGTATTTWTYNAKRGWLDSKRYQDTTGPSYTYTPGGKLAKRTWQRGIETAYAYNTFGDLVGVDYSDSATPDVSYVYNRDDRRQQVTDGSGVRTISYDALGQVATESYTSGSLAGWVRWGQPFNIDISLRRQAERVHGGADRREAILFVSGQSRLSMG